MGTDRSLDSQSPGLKASITLTTHTAGNMGLARAGLAWAKSTFVRPRWVLGHGLVPWPGLDQSSGGSDGSFLLPRVQDKLPPASNRRHTPVLKTDTAQGGNGPWWAGRFCLGMQPGRSPHIPRRGGSAALWEEAAGKGTCSGLLGKSPMWGMIEVHTTAVGVSLSPKAILARILFLNT